MKQRAINVFLFGLLLSFWSCNNQSSHSITKRVNLVEPKFHFISPSETKISDGILADRCTKNIENLYMSIETDSLKKVFFETHDNWYAEPEFVGHYLATGPLMYQSTGLDEIKNRNYDLVGTVVERQREDGYLGTYEKGKEFGYTFSVWNQNFMIKGLLAQYQYFDNQDALEAAMKCADYNANAFLYSDSVELLLGLNQGIQHATILEEIANLYAITGKQLYLDFANYIIQRLENSSIKVVTIPNTAEHWAIPNMMGCTKGIEMFNIYFGVLKMYAVTGDEKYLTAAHQYWKALQDKQIRITGNGTIGEHWNALGNKPIDLSNDLKPNENCVAMGWMKFSADLATYCGESKFFDEFEKTLFNHLIGSQALDGSDFSYYQGNCGHKVHFTDPGAYSCCKYRGMRILAALPEYIYMQSENEVAVNLYTSSYTTATINDKSIAINQTSDFPRSGKVTLEIKPPVDMHFSLLMRKPVWSGDVDVEIDGRIVQTKFQDGYLVLEREWPASGSKISLSMKMNKQIIKSTINNEERVAVKFGPVVLALDSRFGDYTENVRLDLDSESALKVLELDSDEFMPQVKFLAKGEVNGKSKEVILVDYASAGSLNPGKDKFKVWIPTAN